MMEVDIKELEGPPRRPIFGFHNPTNYCHGIASLVAVRHALYCLGLCAEQEQLMPASCSDLKTGLRCIQHVFARSEYPLHLQDDYDASMNHLLDLFPNLFRVTSCFHSTKGNGHLLVSDRTSNLVNIAFDAHTRTNLTWRRTTCPRNLL